MASAPVRGGQSDDAARPATRPRELQDWLNRRLYHPLAARLARALRPTFVSPNAVSVAGALLIWGAAWAYSSLAWPLSALLGFLFHVSWHVVDGADGDLARLRGTSSASGELVDGLCDYVGHIVLYVALAVLLDDMMGGWAWALVVVAGVSHIMQSNHAESQRRAYLWWVHGVPWLKHASASGDAVFQGKGWFSRSFGWMGRGYVRLANAMTPHIASLDAALEAAAPANRPRLRRLARRALERSLRFQKLLGANPRTLILGASMAAGSPLWFFLAEAVLLNALLIASLAHHKAVGARLIRAFG